MILRLGEENVRQTTFTSSTSYSTSVLYFLRTVLHFFAKCLDTRRQEENNEKKERSIGHSSRIMEHDFEKEAEGILLATQTCSAAKKNPGTP
jgi:hypothetical protein